MINQAYTPSINGLQSYIDAAPSYELAPIGIASMQDQAQKLAEMGRNGDIYVVHAAEGETVIPMEVLEANPQIKALLFNQMTEMGLDPQRYVVGDKLNSLNPVTGMPEFFFKSIFKGIKKAVKSVVKVVKEVAPVALPIILSFTGFPAFMGAAFKAGTIGAAALSSGIGTLIGGGDLKEAFKSALWSGASAGIFGGLKGAFSAGPGQRIAGFGAGVKGAALGKVPIYAAGKLIGHQAPATLAERWADITSGNFGDAITGAGGQFTPTSGTYIGPGGGLSIDPITGLPKGIGATQYVPSLSTDPTSTTIGASRLGRPAVSPVSGGQQFSVDWANAPELPSGTQTLVPPGSSSIPPPAVNEFLPNPQYNILNPATHGNQLIQTRSPNLVQRLKSGVGNLFQSNPTDLTQVIDPTSKTGAILDLSTNEGLQRYAALKDAGLLKEPGVLTKLGLPSTGNALTNTALYGGGAYLGAKALGIDPFAVAEQEEITEEDRPDIGGGRVLTLAERQALADEQELEQASVNPFLFTPSQDVLQPTIFSAAGGSVEYPRRELLVEGPGTEKSDDIPAMLSDGEFVINSKAVRGADPSGRGNRYAGAQNLYNLMRNFEMRA